MEPACLPDELLYKEPRRLKDLSPGDHMLVIFTSFHVDEQRRCFLDGNADERKGGGSTILVRRDTDGNYHVDMPSDHVYKPKPLLHGKDILADGIETVYLPVASINIVEPRA